MKLANYEIENITVWEYLTLQDASAYNIFINTLEPNNKFAGRTTNPANFTYDEVEMIKKIYLQPDNENIEYLIT